jgi:hypothetical protein
MNATNDRTTFDRRATAFSPRIKSDWTQSRQVVREICVERARAVFLATRWTVLLETAADSASRTLAETTRLELRMAVRRYARLLLELGEPRSQSLLLVAELAAEVARHNGWDAAAADDLRDEMVEWAMDVSPR